MIIILIIITILYLSPPLMGLFRDKEANDSNGTLNG